MNSKLQNIFSTTECPGSDKLRKYLNQSLSREETRQVEMHLVDCDACSDELEGMSMIEEPKLKKHLADITKKINPAPKPIYYKIAAAVALLVVCGLAVLIYKMNQNNGTQFLSINTQAKEKQEIVEKNNDEISAQPEKNAEKKEQESTSKIVSDKNKVEKQSIGFGSQSGKGAVMKEAAAESIITTTEKISSPGSGKKEVDQLAENKTVAAIELKEESDMQPKTKEEETKFLESKSEAVKKSDEAADYENLEKNIAAVDKKKDKKSKTRSNSKNENSATETRQKSSNFAKDADNSNANNTGASMATTTASSSDDNAATIYKTAMDFYNENDYSKAIEYFEKITNSKLPDYAENAKWYIAQSYIKKGNNKKAKKYLQMLIDSGSKYKGQAEDLVKSL